MEVEARMRSRILMLALGGAALLILTMMIGKRGGWGRSAGKGRQGAQGAGATTERDARRTGVQAAPRDGQFDDAFATFARACGGELRADDLACHMPEVADPRFHTRFTDHHIRVHRGGE